MALCNTCHSWEQKVPAGTDFFFFHLLFKHALCSYVKGFRPHGLLVYRLCFPPDTSIILCIVMSFSFMLRSIKINVVPIDCKITNFSIYLFVCFLRDYHNYFLAPAQLIGSRKSVSQYTFYSLILSPLLSVITREQHEKHFYNQSGYYGIYGIFNVQSTCPSYHIVR